MAECTTEKFEKRLMGESKIEGIRGSSREIGPIDPGRGSDDWHRPWGGGGGDELFSLD